MRLNWYGATSSIVLWSEYGIYSWFSTGQQINIHFYPRPPKTRVVELIGAFIGENRIQNAEDAVERDMLTRSGHWLEIRHECMALISAAMREAESEDG